MHAMIQEKYKVPSTLIFFSFSGLRRETFLFRLDAIPLEPIHKFFKNQNVDFSLIGKGGANSLFLVHSMY